MNGGPSQVDTFDPKPKLDALHGKPVPDASLRTERKTAGVMRSPFKFSRYGQSGLEVSELFAKTASRHADRMCVIRSMQAEVPNHEPSLMLMNTGDGRLPRPSVGSWLLYGLGTEGSNLPAFVVLCPGGLPIVGVQNWRSAFLPGAYQGVHLDTAKTEPGQLLENLRHPTLTSDKLRPQYDLMAALNRRHLARQPDAAALEALAPRMALEHAHPDFAPCVGDYEAVLRAVFDAHATASVVAAAAAAAAEGAAAAAVAALAAAVAAAAADVGAGAAAAAEV
jgi:hypothetical protein